MAHRVLLQFILVFLCVNQGLCESKYKAGFTAGAESCSNYNNEKFNADNMKLGKMDSEDEDGAGLMCIEGSLELHMKIDEGVLININIKKETDAGTEPMMTSAMDMCQCIKDEDAPWRPIFEAMGITSCPVEKGEYGVSNMTIPLDFVSDILTHEFVGDYLMEIILSNPQNEELSCHLMGLCIVEYDD